MGKHLKKADYYLKIRVNKYAFLKHIYFSGMRFCLFIKASKGTLKIE